jgi:signal transduction histidine kinase
MALAAALIYWVIVALWATVLGTLIVVYIRNPRVFGPTRLLLTVVAIDTSRNVIENTYFGLYFGGQYGLFPAAVVGALGNPYLLIIPKVINVIAGGVVLGLLLLRWLPSAIAEHQVSMHAVSDARTLATTMDEFVANVSHELRTPMTSIAGSLGLLAGGAAGPLSTDAGRLVSIAHTSAQRMVRLVNDILDIGRLESGKIAFDFAPVDLHEAAEQAIGAVAVFAMGHGASVRLGAASPGCLVRADSDRLVQVFTNLLSNAIKFSPPQGEVLVTIGKSRSAGWVSVTDQGSGIPKEFEARIFGKFAQAETGNTRQKGGSGLGLHIVANILAQQGGTIGFEAAPGGGTTFHFELPLWNAAAEKTSPVQ